MADPIPDHYQFEFSRNWLHRVQQTKCRLDAFIEYDDYTGERKRYDRIGAQTSRLKTERKGPTVVTDPTTDFRWAARKSYELTNMLDEDDAMNLGQMVLPTSDLVRTHANAYHRDCDDAAWGAAVGSVITGVDGTTVTAFPTSTNYIGKDGTVGGDSGTGVGLTISKLITANELLQDADLEDDSPRVLVCTAGQIADLLNDSKIQSSDYNSVKALVAGDIDTFMGFKFVRTELITKDSNNYRKVLCFPKSAIIVGMAEGIQTRIDQRPDLNYTWQVWSQSTFGAVRTWREKVVSILCDETA